MKLRYIVLSSIVIIFEIIGYFIYSFFYGNPIAKEDFKKEVKEYIYTNYTEEMVIDNIEYSFKESTSLLNSHFIAVVHPKNNPNKIIRIDEGYDGKLQSYNVENK